ncbi:MAG: acetyl-CoA carboxylase biotin carboxylase subunit [Thermomicrobiales bacterium]|nr:acetyl-CoA carboxylase biotin carboxylase subunit [Thermomicrobiales bacterium]MCO5221022.1 acetyl-CoA carboxylase biotin carboxylase subunit [Thermomicrobiales bacterium]
MSFDRVLIANRGEIAVRVIRACRDLGCSPVAIYGPREEGALHVRLADDAYAISDANGLPYLDIDQILQRAAESGANAVHPGYGFLAENATFAQRCAEAGIVFVGPPATAIAAMGSKIEARAIAVQAGVPVVPGTGEPLAGVKAAVATANAIGFPVAFKASAGGGGRGFRVAQTADEVEDAFNGSSGEASRYFGNPAVYAERYLGAARHIEMQLMADRHGNAVWLGERDCSVQRRHQKLIEEAPAVDLRPETRQALGEASVALARAVGYENAGTVEFMVEPSGEFFFLEMNTRIQVEHTITEETTGIDLVREQLLVAAGEPLSFAQESIETKGHAIQLRINAEDPGRNFAPMPGAIDRLRFPLGPGVRIDSAAEPGSVVLPAYDSLIAKLVITGRDRDEALARARRALDEFEIGGVPSTVGFHRRVMDDPAFIAGGVTTRYLTEHPEVIPPAWDGTVAVPEDDFSQNEQVMEVNGRRFTVRTYGQPLAPARSTTPSNRQPPRRNSNGAGGRGSHGSNELISPIQGTVLRVAVEIGAAVAAGDLVAVVEAMKMENEIRAHKAGAVLDVLVAPADRIAAGAVLARIGED